MAKPPHTNSSTQSLPTEAYISQKNENMWHVRLEHPNAHVLKTIM